MRETETPEIFTVLISGPTAHLGPYSSITSVVQSPLSNPRCIGLGDDAKRLLGGLLRPGVELGLGGNPWEFPPATVVQRGMSSIRGYYDELRRWASPVKMQSLKVVFAGHSGAGKTRYTRQYAPFFDQTGAVQVRF